MAGSAKRIFLCEGVVQGRSISGSCARQSAVTPTHTVFRRYGLDKAADSAQLIFLRKNDCSGTVQIRVMCMHANARLPKDSLASLAHLIRCSRVGDVQVATLAHNEGPAELDGVVELVFLAEADESKAGLRAVLLIVDNVGTDNCAKPGE